MVISGIELEPKDLRLKSKREIICEALIIKRSLNKTESKTVDAPIIPKVIPEIETQE